jgi:triosephosphate isomerase (TIM)
MRRIAIVAAHKLYLSYADSQRYAQELVRIVQEREFLFDIIVCPSFISLANVSSILKGSSVGVGAQNVQHRKNGAFTGQISMPQLLDVGVKYVIVGHSELRGYQGETPDGINKKIQMCLDANTTPIICVGEKKEDRLSGIWKKVIADDVQRIFKDIGCRAFNVENSMISYEPVWAIKSGADDLFTKPADPEIANEVHTHIRDVLSDLYGKSIASKIRILYGGSVDPNNARGYIEQPSIDGLLVGSASRRIESFVGILDAAEEVVKAGLKNSTIEHQESLR